MKKNGFKMKGVEKLNGCKKGSVEVSWVVVGLIVSVLTFMVYAAFLSGILGSSDAMVKDIQCRAYVVAKDTKIVEIGEYFYELKQRCGVNDPVDVDLSDKEDSFEKIAKGMSGCWYRYGEGEYDFLSNFKDTGNWCFLCGSVDFEENSNSYTYMEFLDWTKENNYNDSMTYYDYIGVKYVSIDGEEAESIRGEYDNLVNDGDNGAEIRELLLVLGDQIQYMDDLRLKQISSSDDQMFIVYRYDRVDKSFGDKMADAGETAAYTAIASIVVGATAEWAVETVATAGFGAGFSLVKNIASAIYKGGKVAEKVKKITALISRVSDVIMNSKKVKRVSEVVDMDKISDFVGLTKRDEIFNMIDKVEDVASQDALRGVVDMMDALGVDDLNDIKDIQKNLLNNIDLVDGLFVKQREKIEKARSAAEVSRRTQVADRLDGELLELDKQYTQLNDLHNEALSALKTSVGKGEVSEASASKIRNYIRMSIVVFGAGTGAYVGYNTNDQYEQYVDIMTPEQYYRLCGTTRSYN